MSESVKRVVYNNCYGGFSLSAAATLRLYELGCTSIATPVEKYWKPDEAHAGGRFGKSCALNEWRDYLANPSRNRGTYITVFSPDEKFVLYASNVARDDPLLLQVVDEMGEAANGQFAKLTVAEIPADVQWQIEEYDGNERVAEAHRRWG